MNKIECKKYLRESYKRIIAHNKDITPKNMEIVMRNVINEQIEEYIAYVKIAINNMQNSANKDITLKDLLSEIDILPKIYTSYAAKEKARRL